MSFKRALLVGIDAYPDPQNNLNSCVADTWRFKGLLEACYGFAAQDIVLLHNSNATLDNVRGQLARLVDGISAGDRVVFFESSHGYRYVKGSVYTEVLCLYDQFLEDAELVELSNLLPPGTLSCVIDACHAGGLEKLFFTPAGLQAARAKVWQPSPERAAADLASIGQATSFKSFTQPATSDTGTVAKRFSPAAFGSSAAPAAKDAAGSELNGVIFKACLADQAAAAGSPPTDGLSAFTWALGREIEAGGPGIAASVLQDRVDQRLQSLNLLQTPIVEAPLAHAEWLGETLISFGSPTQTEGAQAPREPNMWEEFLGRQEIGS